MIFSRYGIDLERMAKQHLAMVREWRNSDWIRQHMQFRDTISLDSQKAWYEQLHPRNDWYFIGLLNTLPFGLFHVKNISWLKSRGEAGAFVADPAYLGDPNAALAILALMDFSFFVLGLDTLEAKFNPAFKEIETLNSQLGYQIFAEETEGFVRAEVTVSRYQEAASRLRAAAEKLWGTKTVLKDGDEWIKKRLKKIRDGNGIFLL